MLTIIDLAILMPAAVLILLGLTIIAAELIDAALAWIAATLDDES